MNNVFTELDKKNINHFIIVSINSLKGFLGGYSSTTYTLYVLKKDAQQKRINGFKESYDNKWLRLQELSECNIRSFKQILDNYKKVQHNEDGRIYELKDNSFKQYYDSQYQKLDLNFYCGNCNSKIARKGEHFPIGSTKVSCDKCKKYETTIVLTN